MADSQRKVQDCIGQGRMQAQAICYSTYNQLGNGEHQQAIILTSSLYTAPLFLVRVIPVRGGGRGSSGGSRSALRGGIRGHQGI